MSKIFIAQEINKAGGIGRVDYSPAREYGDEIIVLCGNGFLPQEHTKLKEDLMRKLLLFNHREDYLILSGDTSISALVVAIVVDSIADESNERKADDSFNVLSWDRRAMKYYPRKITFR